MTTVKLNVIWFYCHSCLIILLTFWTILNGIWSFIAINYHSRRFFYQNIWLNIIDMKLVITRDALFVTVISWKILPFIDWISVVGDLKIGKSVIRVTFIYNFTVFRYFFYYLRVYDFYHVFFILLRFIIRENENCCVPLEGWILIKMSLNQEIVHIDVLKTRAIEQISWKSLEKRKKYRRLLTLLLLVSMASSSSLHNNSLCFSSSTNACSIQVTHINDVKWISIAYWHAHRSKCSHK